jgi:hypothetical protein
MRLPLWLLQAWRQYTRLLRVAELRPDQIESVVIAAYVRVLTTSCEYVVSILMGGHAATLQKVS